MEYLTPEEEVIVINTDAVIKCPVCAGIFHTAHQVGFIKEKRICQFCIALEDPFSEDNRDLNSFYIGEIK